MKKIFIILVLMLAIIPLFAEAIVEQSKHPVNFKNYKPGVTVE